MITAYCSKRRIKINCREGGWNSNVINKKLINLTEAIHNITLLIYLFKMYLIMKPVACIDVEFQLSMASIPSH